MTNKPATRQKAWETSVKLLAFIHALEKNGNVTDALHAASASRPWIYKKRKTNPEFADAFEEARACGIEVLKDEAHRRAYGFDDPVYRTAKNGQRVKCGSVRRWSDVLLMFLIKQSDPTYREHYQIDHGNAGSRPFLFSMSLHPDAVAAKAATQ